MPVRFQKSARGASLVGLAAMLGLLTWGTAIEPRFLLDAQETEAYVPDLPSTWAGRRAVLLADLQTGMWWGNTGMIRHAVERAIEEQPAFALIAGDFVYEPDSARIRQAIELVRPLPEAGIPTYAVLGNHDYGLGGDDAEPHGVMAQNLERGLESVGITVLENESTVETLEDGRLYIAGIGSEWAHRSRPAAAVAEIPEGAARIVFMHNPISFRTIPAGQAPAAFAAHTHGGQIRLPFLKSESWLDIARSREVIADGWAMENVGREGNGLYVNRGLGFSIVPVRILCRPELTVITLRKAEERIGSNRPGVTSVSSPGDAHPSLRRSVTFRSLPELAPES